MPVRAPSYFSEMEGIFMKVIVVDHGLETVDLAGPPAVASVAATIAVAPAVGNLGIRAVAGVSNVSARARVGLRHWPQTGFSGESYLENIRRKAEREQRQAEMIAEKVAEKLQSGAEQPSTVPKRLSKDECNSEMMLLVERHPDEATDWSAADFKSAIERDGTKLTSESTIKTTTMWAKLMERTGRGRKRRPATQAEDSQLLDKLISQQQREAAAESGRRIKGRKVSSRD